MSNTTEPPATPSAVIGVFGINLSAQLTEAEKADVASLAQSREPLRHQLTAHRHDEIMRRLSLEAVATFGERVPLSRILSHRAAAFMLRCDLHQHDISALIASQVMPGGMKTPQAVARHTFNHVNDYRLGGVAAAHAAALDAYKAGQFDQAATRFVKAEIDVFALSRSSEVVAFWDFIADLIREELANVAAFIAETAEALAPLGMMPPRFAYVEGMADFIRRHDTEKARPWYNPSQQVGGMTPALVALGYPLAELEDAMRADISAPGWLPLRERAAG